MYFYKGHSEIKGHIFKFSKCMVPTCHLNTIVERSMMKTSFILPISPFFPPNTTALLPSTAVNVWPEHGGGLSPVVAGQLHTPAVKIEETIKQILINNAQTNAPCIVPKQMDVQMILFVLNFNKSYLYVPHLHY